MTGLYGAKCSRCTHILHTGPQADAPIPWLEILPLECPDCSFCQEAALLRGLATIGLTGIEANGRRAIKAFRNGDPDPILDRLRTECLAIESPVTIGGEVWRVVDAQFDDGEVGSHLHLTLVPPAGAAGPQPERPCPRCGGTRTLTDQGRLHPEPCPECAGVQSEPPEPEPGDEVGR